MDNLNGVVTAIRLEGTTYSKKLFSASCSVKDSAFDDYCFELLKERINDRFSKDLNIIKHMRLILNIKKDGKKLAGGSVAINKIDKSNIDDLVKRMYEGLSEVYASNEEDVPITVCQLLFSLRLESM
jgi:hypothetical protein